MKKEELEGQIIKDDYIEIIKTLDNNKGTIYLDSGNYFEIKNAES